jgi:SAM-dependent methyltransferase
MNTKTSTKLLHGKNSFYRDLPADYGVKDLPGLELVLPTECDESTTVVELGCGAGHVAAAVKKRFPGCRVIATDLFPDCLRVAEGNYPELEVMQLDADAEFPLDDGSVDLIISSNLYEHLHDEERHLRNISRVLRDGGKYFISTPHFFADLVWGLIAPNVQQRFSEIIWRVKGDTRTQHCNLKTVRTLRRTLRQAGFGCELLRRDRFSTNEIQKLNGLCKWLPTRVRKRAVSLLATLWLRCPQFLQPTIVVCVCKEPAL